MKKPDKNTKETNERPVYILCPRCEINYIDKKDKYCAVCKAELGMGDPFVLLPDEEEAEVDRICPICHVNLLADDEDVCFECKKDMEEKEKESSELTEDSEDWEPYADDDEEEEIPDGMQEILDEDDDFGLDDEDGDEDF